MTKGVSKRLTILTHYARLLLSHPGVRYLYPPPRVALAPMLSHTLNYFLMTTTTRTT